MAVEKRVLFRSRWLPWLLLAPQAVVIAVFFYWPAAQALIQSFQLQDVFGLSVSWVGLDNFRTLFADPSYLGSFRITAFFSLAVAISGIAISLALAVVVATDRYIARDAVDRIEVDWEPLDAVADPAIPRILFFGTIRPYKGFDLLIDACLSLQDRLTAANMAIPMWMMADIDHGDVTSSNPDDYDPYAWARAVPPYSPIIHIKQSLMDKGGHRPFTAEFNARGRIQPAKLLAAFEEGGAQENEICLELSFKEREPDDRQVIPQIAESVAFWAPHISTGSQFLNV